MSTPFEDMLRCRRCHLWVHGPVLGDGFGGGLLVVSNTQTFGIRKGWGKEIDNTFPQVYHTSANLCRRPGKRPDLAEALQCRDNLIRQILTMRPRCLLVEHGMAATSLLFGCDLRDLTEQERAFRMPRVRRRLEELSGHVLVWDLHPTGRLDRFVDLGDDVYRSTLPPGLLTGVLPPTPTEKGSWRTRDRFNLSLRTFLEVAGRPR